MTGNGWLYKSSPARLPGIECRSVMAILLAGEITKEKKNNCKSGFLICKLWVLISLRLFCQQWRAHMVPGLHIPTHRAERRQLSVCIVCLFWRGVTMGLPRGHASSDGIRKLFFSFCDSILLVFWAQSTVHMVLAAPWMANVSVTVKPIRQDWEVWENRGVEEFVTERKVWRQRHRRYNNLLSAHLLSSIWCCWNASSSFEMPPRMAEQGWKIGAVDKLTGSASHVSLLTPMHEQGAQWGPLSYWCHLSLSFIPPRSSEKASHLKLSRSCLNPHC